MDEDSYRVPHKYGGLGFVGVSLQSDLQKYATYI